MASISNCSSPSFSCPVNSSSSVMNSTSSLNAETMMVEASAQKNKDSFADQSIVGSLPHVASSISHDLNAVVEASPQEDVEELSCNPPNDFVPSIGEWAKPLAFAPPATPPTPATPLDFDPQDGSMSDATANLNMSRFQNFQDMEWKTA
ncbi:unnamed protein product [Eruca vesicaria subsp. sativa]|uniref:Uncharacterized protein n=1 Tax=Eruca vesicaria subsp. sativa TaxID=29727 RepID=A0ABC8KPM6_ERUVS|nr:unnamed protein product [Eruca vesicaria subsp. sativa]